MRREVSQLKIKNKRNGAVGAPCGPLLLPAALQMRDARLTEKRADYKHYNQIK